ncbi:MAG: hypothetical protein ACETVX_07135 [bacterium]
MNKIHRAAYQKEYREKYGDKMHEQVKAWFGKHPDYLKRWRKAHPGYFRDWYKRHIDYFSEYRIRNLERLRVYWREYKRKRS